MSEVLAAGPAVLLVFDYGTLTTAELAERVLPEVIFHFAAQIDVRKSTADPAWDASINVLGTINLLQAALEAGVDPFINTFTGGANYGWGPILPAPEGHSPAPDVRPAPRLRAARR